MKIRRVPADRYLLFGLIAVAGLTVDLYSKHAVFADIGFPIGGAAYHTGAHDVFAHPPRREGESRPYLQGWVTFRLFASFNRGALWGVGQNLTAVFALASVAAIAGILVWLFGYAAARSRWLTVALALVMAGTLGNLWDRLGLHGCTDPQGEPIHAVRDFLLFTFGDYHYPIFNFADSFLVTGAIMLVIQSLFLASPAEAAAQTAKVAEQKPEASGGA